MFLSANHSYRALFEANPQPMWVFDLETRAFLTVNDAAVARYGYSRDEFGELTIDVLRPEEDLPALLDHLEGMTMDGQLSGGWRHLTKDGEILDVEIYSHGLEIEGRDAVLVQVQDVTARRSAERDRRLLSEAVSAAANAVVITDIEGVVQWVNPAFTRITGYELVEAVGRRPQDLVKSGEHDDAFYSDLWTTILSGEVWRGRVLNRRKDGTRYVADETITPVPGEDGRIAHFISVHEDVTRTVSIEEDLKERVKELRVLYNATRSLHDTTLSFDERLQRVVDILPGGFLYPEVTEARLTLRDITVETPGFRETPWTLSTEIALKERVIGRLEVALVEERPERDHGPFLKEESDLLESLAHAVDEALEHQRLVVISREISEVIYILDSDAVVRFSTPSVKEAAGYSRKEFEGTQALDLVHEEDRARVGEQFQSLYGKSGDTTRTQYRIRKKDGQIRHVESVARNLMDHPGVGGILVTSRDVTERTELEERMQEGQRMESIGRLAGGVAHDFNNLLTVIRSQTDLLLLDLDSSDPMAPEIEVIQTAADRAATLTSQLLAFSRDQVLRPRVVQLCNVVRSTLGLVERIIGEDVRVEMDLPGDRPPVEVDPSQLEQVVLNLAVNARAAMPDGGLLRLRTFREEVDEVAARDRGDLEPGLYTVLEVSDSGVGMNDEVRSRVFEPFFTTKGKAGTGLGLSMAYGFVKQSGGTVRVESAPGRGTTFLLWFRAVDRPADETEATGTTESSGLARVHGSRAVLVVEDDPSVRRVVARVLERAGMEIVQAEDAEGALALLGAGHPVDLVLSDLGLPGLSGRALAERLRESYPGLPVIVMSGYAAGSPGRADDLPSEIPFIQKPFTPGTLIRMVRHALTAD